jgi:hypothetical protein
MPRAGGEADFGIGVGHTTLESLGYDQEEDISSILERFSDSRRANENSLLVFNKVRLELEYTTCPRTMVRILKHCCLLKSLVGQGIRDVYLFS